MSIVKWKVSTYGGIVCQEYDKETDHYYCYRDRHGNIRRDAKISIYESFFDTEAEALEYVEKKKAAKVESKRIDKIKQHAVELLEAAERYLNFRHTGDIGMGHEYSGEHPQTQLKSIIAKAKGEA